MLHELMINIYNAYCEGRDYSDLMKQAKAKYTFDELSVEWLRVYTENNKPLTIYKG